MDTIASRVRANADKSFEDNFDLPIFLKFIEDKLSNHTYVNIGIVSSPRFEGLSNYLKSKRSVTGYSTDRAFPTFADGEECYIWTTQCQIPAIFANNVVNALHIQGLRTSIKGACGNPNGNIIEVSL